MEKTIRLPQLAWQNAPDLELTFPEKWELEVCNMAGYDRKALTVQEIRESVRNPLRSLPIRVLARDRQQVVIIFDDMARATRVSQIVPFILEELAEAGIADKNIRFIAATGCHGAMNRQDFVKKLGEGVLHRFPAFSHNAFGHCVKIGTTTLGTEICANAEVMRCDLKIAIGSIAPHPAAGFSGGGKIILPGICSFETNSAFHRSGSEYQRKGQGKPAARGIVDGNPLRLNQAEAVKMVGLDIIIDTMSNSHGELVALYVGDPEVAFPEAVKDARTHYLTSLAQDSDIVIANTFSKASEIEFGLEIAYKSVKKDGGQVVLIGNAPEGHVAHYLFGSWGTAGHSSSTRQEPPSQVSHLYILNEYPDLTVMGHFTEPDKVSMSTKWEDILTSLKKSYADHARVAVYPNADIQYCVEP